MPSRCSAPGCRSNYDDDERIPVFKMPHKPDELRHAWIRALHRDDIHELKTVYVCSQHFREEEIERTYKVPTGDGTYREMPRKYLKLKEGAVPSILPGCPTYYSTQTTNKRSRLSIESKREELFSQALHLSLKSNIDESERFILRSFQDLQAKLPLISISNVWSYWYPNPNSLIFMRPRLDNNKILVNIYLTVEIDLSIRAYRNGEVFQLSLISVSDTCQLESLLDEIAVLSDSSEMSLGCTSNDSHIASAGIYIQQVINNISDNKSDEEFHNCPGISKLQFIHCQLQNSLIPKNRRRYNILTQVLSLKTHLISPSCYKYLQSMSCLSLPHFNTLEKLYSSFGLDSNFFTFLRQSTQSFSPQQKHVIIQMDEIHVKSDISTKEERYLVPILMPMILRKLFLLLWYPVCARNGRVLSVYFHVLLSPLISCLTRLNLVLVMLGIVAYLSKSFLLTIILLM